jgi:hypothetical protein
MHGGVSHREGLGRGRGGGGTTTYRVPTRKGRVWRGGRHKALGAREESATARSPTLNAGSVGSHWLATLGHLGCGKSLKWGIHSPPLSHHLHPMASLSWDWGLLAFNLVTTIEAKGQPMWHLFPSFFPLPMNIT